MGELICKICARGEWEAAVAVGVYEGSEVDRKDGFIHFSRAHQVAGTQAKYFAGQGDLVLVKVDAESLGGSLRFEVSRGGEAFPHLYAVLSMASVVSVEPLAPVSKE